MNLSSDSTRTEGHFSSTTSSYERRGKSLYRGPETTWTGGPYPQTWWWGSVRFWNHTVVREVRCGPVLRSVNRVGKVTNPQTRLGRKSTFLEQHHHQRNEEGTRIVDRTPCRRGGLILGLEGGKCFCNNVDVKEVNNDPL